MVPQPFLQSISDRSVMKIKTAAVLGAGAVGSHQEEKSDGLFDDEARNEKGEETLK